MNVREVVKSAVENFAPIYSGPDLRLEEVFLNEDETIWLATLSYPNPDFEAESADVEAGSGQQNLQAIFGRSVNPRRRVAKKVKLRAQDGSFIGIVNG